MGWNCPYSAVKAIAQYKEHVRLLLCLLVLLSLYVWENTDSLCATRSHKAGMFNIAGVAHSTNLQMCKHTVSGIYHISDCACSCAVLVVLVTCDFGFHWDSYNLAGFTSTTEPWDDLWVIVEGSVSVSHQLEMGMAESFLCAKSVTGRRSTLETFTCAFTSPTNPYRSLRGSSL